VHRGRLQGVIHQAVRSRLGESRLHTGHRLGGFAQDESGVTAWFFDRNGSHRRTAKGDVLIGADGIHSYVRGTLYPNEGRRAGTARCCGAARSTGRNSSPAARW
jgi:2-polyprenyl-6-methoxyphenol hydroxylase-like FAD-dependent oxidoreductase